MATYYHHHGNSEIQGGGGGGDGLQTLILMNPAYVGYSDTQQQQQQQQQQPPQPPQPHQHHHHGNNLVFLNSNNSGNSLALPHAPPQTNMQTQQFVGIPLTASPTVAVSSHSPHSHHHSDISALHGFIPRVQYNLYNSVDLAAAREASRPQQGLSLSLSPQQPAAAGYVSFRQEREVAPSQALVTTVSPVNGDTGGGSSSSASGVSNGMNGMRSVMLSSKYLKAAQELLEEVVNVGKGAKMGESGKGSTQPTQTPKSIGESSTPPPTAAGDGRDSGGKRGPELSTAERQEIQMKKAKLVNMLDEVEQRYRQYHHQMQIVITWFEQVAGVGSAKTYTALALQTISKQFRCLKDAILGQIRAASKSLGEEERMGGKMEGSRLKFVDNQLRQQRALQQLGMIQQNAWRPQRGLPERSVSVLRAWLFEHFLHPYPKDSDKIMLAKQTGLTRSQVSNWFINARVRLWKPMVEEMYMEEMKEQEKNGAEEKAADNVENENSTPKATAHSHGFDNFLPKQDNANANANASGGVISATQKIMPAQISMSTTSNSPNGMDIQNHSGFNLIVSSEMESISQGSPKKLRGAAEVLHSPPSMEAKANDHMGVKQGGDGFTLMGAPTNFIGGFGSYTMGELGRFGADQFPGSYPGNGVSLTLGLPHCESLPMSGNYQTFLPSQNVQLGRGVEMEEGDFSNLNPPSSTHSANLYENLNIQNRKRFAARLLPDFVA